MSIPFAFALTCLFLCYPFVIQAYITPFKRNNRPAFVSSPSKPQLEALHMEDAIAVSPDDAKPIAFRQVSSVSKRSPLDIFFENEKFATVEQVPSPVSSLKAFYAVHLEQWYNEALSIKCPFMRRRKLDIIEGIEDIVRKLIHALDCSGNDDVMMDNVPRLSCRGNPRTWSKNKNMDMEDIVKTIRKDWREDNNFKGYYITGKLNSTIYRDDCLFDGPDPDMPVKGLTKYQQVASQLFDSSASNAELLTLNSYRNKKGQSFVFATWRISAVMRLPWRPQLPEVIGSTTYHLDQDGLIYKHVETWNIPAFQAFLSILPKMKDIEHVIIPH